MSGKEGASLKGLVWTFVTEYVADVHALIKLGVQDIRRDGEKMI